MNEYYQTEIDYFAESTDMQLVLEEEQRKREEQMSEDSHKGMNREQEALLRYEKNLEYLEEKSVNYFIYVLEMIEKERRNLLRALSLPCPADFRRVLRMAIEYYFREAEARYFQDYKFM